MRSENVSVEIPPQQPNENPETEKTKEEITLRNLNRYTLLYKDNINERSIYVFNYTVNLIQTDETELKVLNLESLMYLKANKKWNLLKHPYIFNYVNEILVESALLYFFQLFLYFVYLTLLYVYISTECCILAYILVPFLFYMVFMAFIKAIFKIERSKPSNPYEFCTLSFRFCFSHGFTVISYCITLVWIIFSKCFEDGHEYSDSNNSQGWLQIIVIFTSWIQCLFVLKKTFFGLYILMLIKIFYSFLKLSVIWITTIVCFAFSFQHVMRESNVYPWDSNVTKNVTLNKSTIQSFTKVSVMMIGEIDANDIINKREIIASVILVLFEIIVIIILMNLMMSLAVDDVSKLYDFAEEKLLHIKVNYCIEMLHLSQYCCSIWPKLHNMRIRNIMIDSKQHRFQFSKRFTDKTHYGLPLFYEIYPNSSLSRTSPLSINDVWIQILNSNNIECGSLDNEALKNYLRELRNDEGKYRKFRRIFIGLNFQYCSAKKCECKCCGH